VPHFWPTARSGIFTHAELRGSDSAPNRQTRACPLPRLRRSVGSNLQRREAQSATQKTVAENVVVLSEAEDPLLSAPARKQVLRFAQDDNRLVSLRPRRLGGESAYDPALISVARSFSNVITNGFPRSRNAASSNHSRRNLRARPFRWQSWPATRSSPAALRERRSSARHPPASGYTIRAGLG